MCVVEDWPGCRGVGVDRDVPMNVRGFATIQRGRSVVMGRGEKKGEKAGLQEVERRERKARAAEASVRMRNS